MPTLPLNPYLAEGFSHLAADARIYNDIQELSIIAKRYYLIAGSQKQKEPLKTGSSASSVKFAEVRARLLKSINDRINEISQYDHPAEPADK